VDIRNTTADMNDPDSPDRLLLLAVGMHTGSPAEFIEAQEKQGQAQLVASEMLPTRVLHCTDADFAALGFRFGAPDPGDPMFRPATLPEGWKKVSSDHDMWSYVVDTLGRRRVAIFYKAAFYDRSAHMRVERVSSYVSHCVYYGHDIVPDDEWATPAAIVEAAREHLGQQREFVEMYSSERFDNEYGREEAAKAEAQCAAYEAVVARFEAAGGAR
jgi:hypothetical protein